MTEELKKIRNNVIKDYQNKMSIENILEKYNIKWRTLSELLSPALDTKRNSVPKELEQYIVDSYIKGKSTTRIGVELGFYHKVIAQILEEHNINRDCSKMNRKYTLNEHYFDNINTPNKAYILGFLYADGNVYSPKSTIRLALHEDDKEILEKINNEIGSNHKLKYSVSKDRGDGYNYCNTYAVEVYSTHMCKVLNDLGCMDNKSLKLKYPTFLSDELHRHFIRGYFDGDGSFCNHKSKKNGRQPLITITSTNDFCIECQRIIRELINIPCGNIYDASCHNGITKVLSFSGGNQVKIFLDWLYEDAELYLKRKYDRYIDAFYKVA